MHDSIEITTGTRRHRDNAVRLHGPRHMIFPLLCGTNTTYVNSALAAGLVGDELSPAALDVLGRLDRFLELRENWDSYGALPPKASTIAQARGMVQHLDQAGVPPYFASPGPGGQVMVEYRLPDDISAELHFAEDGNELLVMRGEEVLYEDRMDLDEFWPHVRRRRAV